MNEKLLQFIWQFQYFNRAGLVTTGGEPVTIIQVGTLNKDQGPDFKNAKIKIAETTWAGHVELHLKTSDWQRHGHDGDKNYNNVVLHVVYENDMLLSEIPVLSIKDKIAHSLLQQYTQLMQQENFIPCARLIHTVPGIIIEAWLETCAVRRLQRKAGAIVMQYEESKHHWETVFWWNLARNFGIKTNASAFDAIAKSLHINILAKHKNNIVQLEAMLLGQAGLLEDEFTDGYAILLKKEYGYLKNKWQLQPVPYPVFFLRMRPGNFPTVRLAQLAALIHQSTHLFANIIDTENIFDIKKILAVTANDFWHYHYTLHEAGTFHIKNLGADMIENICINTIVPVLFAYADYQQNEKLKNKALGWLQQLKPERNTITKGFALLEMRAATAFQSQAMVELKTQYCDRRLCLNCAIGNNILKQQSVQQV